MSLTASSVSLTRYRVEGSLEEPILDTLFEGLNQNKIREIDDDISENSIGWTSTENPFQPNFEGSSFSIGSYWIFSLRIDKKNIPAKVLKKFIITESQKMLSESGREFLNRTEKQMIKDRINNQLLRRYPATPNIYDLVWNYEDKSLWFLSNQKGPNEELETLFSRSFQMSLIRLFPYTAADMMIGLSENQRDDLGKLSPTHFSE